jgi:hypothetical protein
MKSDRHAAARMPRKAATGIVGFDETSKRGSTFDENELPFVIGGSGFDVAIVRLLSVSR